MSTETANLIFAVGAVVAILAAVVGATRYVFAWLGRRKEAEQAKIQRRLDYYREQLKTLQDASAQYDVSAEDSTVPGIAKKAIGSAKAAMLAVGDSELDEIASRLILSVGERTIIHQNRAAVSDGIKRLARLIAGEWEN
jgi:hypothetical protein